MGKIALIVAVLTAVTLASGQAVLLSAQQSKAEARGAHGAEILARQAAQTGHAEAVHILQTGADPRVHDPIEGRVGGAYYRTSFDVVGEDPLSVRVRTEGRHGDKRHVVDALLRDQSAEPPGTPAEALANVPPYLRYAVFSGGDLNLAVLPRVETRDPDLNADIHANGDLNLSLSLNALLNIRPIPGFGTYSDRLRALTLLGEPEDLFRPRSNPEGAPSLRRTDPVPIQPFDLREVAGDEAERTRSQLRLLGAIELGTREDPRIIHVDGDLILIDVRVEGYGAFVVDGSVVIESSVTGLLQSLNEHPESRVAIYADGSIVFNGLGDVEGQFVSNESVTFTGAATLYGSVAAVGPVRFLLAPTVRFVAPSPALTIGLPGNPPPEPMALVATREWEVIE